MSIYLRTKRLRFWHRKGLHVVKAGQNFHGTRCIPRVDVRMYTLCASPYSEPVYTGTGRPRLLRHGTVPVYGLGALERAPCPHPAARSARAKTEMSRRRASGRHPSLRGPIAARLPRARRNRSRPVGSVVVCRPESSAVAAAASEERNYFRVPEPEPQEIRH